MIKTILVAVSGNAADAANLTSGLAVARPFAAHLDVLHVRSDPVAVAVAMTSDVGGGGAMTPGLLEQLERDARERETRARDNFAQFCKTARLAEAAEPGRRGGKRPSVQFHVESGEEPRWMVRYGVAADLIVAPRGTGEAQSGRATLEAVLLETGRPLLIPPAAPLPDEFRRVAIGWKATPQAARAVAAALPFLARAREVVVLTVEEAGGPRDEARRLVQNLAWHGVTAAAKRLPPGSDGPATLIAAAAESADLLVMGGYGHSRLREWAFGGFTELVLDAAPLPVLMAH
jgi:nucleotide-binding universal stress UspA family protein